MKVSHILDQIWANCFVPTKEIIIRTKFKGIKLQNFFHLCFQSFISFHLILGLSFQVFLYIFLSWLFHSIHFIWHFLVELLVVVLWWRSKLFWLNAFHQMLLPFVHSLIRRFVDSLILMNLNFFKELVSCCFITRYQEEQSKSFNIYFPLTIVHLI